MTNNPVMINKIKIYPFASVDELLDYIVGMKKILIALNAEKIINATDGIREIINNNIGYADGIGAVMGLKKKGIKNVIRIPGCELWLKIIERCCLSKSFYLIGGKQNTIEQTVEKLKIEFPGINIVNYRNGYFDELGKKELFQDVKEKKPDIVFVAMGSPKQEVLMEKMLSFHPALYQGLGGSFDIYTNNIDRAPDWWINHNLEWAYRLIKQPTRIKRQICLIKYLLWLFLGLI